MKLTLNKTSVVVGIVTGLIAIGGALFAVDQRYAKTDEVRLVEVRLELKILQDRLNEVQDRIWKLNDRYRGQTMPQHILDEVHALEKEKRQLEMQINQLMKHQRG